MASQNSLTEYGDVHRAFIQAFLAKGVMKKSDARDVFIKILEAFECEFDPNDRKALMTMINGTVQKINRNIRALGMEIRGCRDERTGNTFYVLINTVASAGSVNAVKEFSHEELEFFKLMVATMFAEEDRAVNYRQCLNLTTRLTKRMSMEDGEKFLERLVADKWLEKVDGTIRLHVRALGELEPYLKEKFGLQSCMICKTIVTLLKNQECAECSGQAHWHCIVKQPRRQCPNEECRSPWPEDNQSQTSSNSSTSQRVSVSHKRIRLADDSSENEMDTGESTAKAQKQRKEPDE